MNETCIRLRFTLLRTQMKRSRLFGGVQARCVALHPRRPILALVRLSSSGFEGGNDCHGSVSKVNPEVSAMPKICPLRRVVVVRHLWECMPNLTCSLDASWEALRQQGQR